MSVFAWRTWNLNDEGLLVATAAGVPWRPGINEAKCHRGRIGGWVTPNMIRLHYRGTSQDLAVTEVQEHIAPASDCTCGYWAFKTPARLLREFGHRYSWGASGQGVARRVYGVVELAGRMIELELGYKAQYARIVALAAPEGMKVSPDYGVPVQHDLGELFRTWWDGVQPQNTEWCEERELGDVWLSGGLVQSFNASFAGTAQQMQQMMQRIMQAYGQQSSKSATMHWPALGQEADVTETFKAENPAAERDAKVRARNDRPKHQSTYGPAKSRRK